MTLVLILPSMVITYRVETSINLRFPSHSIFEIREVIMDNNIELVIQLTYWISPGAAWCNKMYKY